MSHGLDSVFLKLSFRSISISWEERYDNQDHGKGKPHIQNRVVVLSVGVGVGVGQQSLLLLLRGRWLIIIPAVLRFRH